MKKAILFWLILIAIKASSQTNLQGAYQISSDTLRRYEMNDSFIRVLSDKSGNLTINDILMPRISISFDTVTANSKLTPSNTYWFQFRLKNIMTCPARISLQSLSEKDDYYIISTATKPVHYASGYLTDLNKKNGLKWGNFIPVIINPGDSITVYQRVYNKKKVMPTNSLVSILPTDIAIKEKYINNEEEGKAVYEMVNLVEAFMVGLLLLSTFFNLFFFSVVKEKEYLYFALFTCFLGINRINNILYIHLGHSDPHLVSYVDYLGFAWLFISFFLLQFVRHFFHVKEKYRKWDKVLFITAIVFISSSVADFFRYTFLINFTHFFLYLNFFIGFFIIPTCVLVTLLLFIRSKNKAFYFFIIAAFPFMFLQILVFPVNGELDMGFSKILPGGVLNFLSQIAALYRPLEMVCVLWLILFFSWTLFIRYNQLRKENAQKDLEKERLAKEKEIEKNQLVEQQKLDLEQKVEERTFELKTSLQELKLTQAQLIQSEKMASLGELTAGIAHEIQNPLNFVNNFSEVNKELLEELKEEADKGNVDEIKAIVNDVIENSEKINHHGKRADSIVKGMLQHTRTSSGQKELTDINKLADEYLKLAYHGLRAKDKSFNSALITNFDEVLGSLNIVAQDITRVLLNIYNNAFYAVNEKAKEGLENYKPVITVTTKKLSGKVEICIRDNGNGIPQIVVDKIFQPFFTTKPAGQGTGLGLSLSYDIIKSHGGEIKVESKDGEGCEFIIELPINNT